MNREVRPFSVIFVYALISVIGPVNGKYKKKSFTKLNVKNLLQRYTVQFKVHLCVYS